jgi:hypothetical protein
MNDQIMHPGALYLHPLEPGKLYLKYFKHMFEAEYIT